MKALIIILLFLSALGILLFVDFETYEEPKSREEIIAEGEALMDEINIAMDEIDSIMIAEDGVGLYELMEQEEEMTEVDSFMLFEIGKLPEWHTFKLEEEL